MPKQISYEEVTDAIIKRTTSVTTKASGTVIKYKLRTPKTLFTVVFEDDKNVEKLKDKLTQANIEITTL